MLHLGSALFHDASVVPAGPTRVLWAQEDLVDEEDDRGHGEADDEQDEGTRHVGEPEVFLVLAKLTILISV